MPHFRRILRKNTAIKTRISKTRGTITIVRDAPPSDETSFVACGSGVKSTFIERGVAVGGLSVAEGSGVIVGGSVCVRKSGVNVKVKDAVSVGVKVGVKVKVDIGVTDGVSVSAMYGVRP